MKAKNGGRGNAEVNDPSNNTVAVTLTFSQMRLESTKFVMVFLPLTSLAYGWFCEKKVHIAAVCASLFLAGFFVM